MVPGKEQIRLKVAAHLNPWCETLSASPQMCKLPY